MNRLEHAEGCGIAHPHDRGEVQPTRGGRQKEMLSQGTYPWFGIGSFAAAVEIALARDYLHRTIATQGAYPSVAV